MTGTSTKRRAKGAMPGAGFPASPGKRALLRPPGAETTMTTKTTIELVIECADEETAAALGEALMPDNRYFPKDQTFDASRSGASLRFEVGSPRPRQALGTVTSIISDARLFRDVWEEAKAGGGH
jgi:hypothetical protein